MRTILRGKERTFGKINVQVGMTTDYSYKKHLIFISLYILTFVSFYLTRQHIVLTNWSKATYILDSSESTLPFCRNLVNVWTIVFNILLNVESTFEKNTLCILLNISLEDVYI